MFRGILGCPWKLFAGSLVLVWVLGHGAAQAQVHHTSPEEWTRDQVRLGQRLAGNDPQGAASAFAAAFVLRPSPEILLSLARMQNRAGARDMAALLLEGAVRAAKEEGQRQALLDELRELRVSPGPAPELQVVVRDLFQGGRGHFEAQRFGPAVEAFRLAYALCRYADKEHTRKAPQLLFTLGQAHRRAKQISEAIWLYERYLQEEKEGRLRSEALGYLSELRLVQDARLTMQKGNTKTPQVPLYRRGWLWAVVSSVAVASGTSIALGVAISMQGPRIVDVYHVRFPEPGGGMAVFGLQLGAPR